MANGDTKTESYLRVAAEGTRADLPTDTCCNTKAQNLILGVANRIMDVEDEVEEMKSNPDVTDIVGTYADLQNYDTSTLTDKDVIRVLNDETHDGDSTYYRYSTGTGDFTYIGESKQYTDFVGTDGQDAGAAGLVPAPSATDADKYLKSDGTWATVSGGGGPTVVQTTGASTTDVMSQDAVTNIVFADHTAKHRISIRDNGPDSLTGDYAVGIGSGSTARGEGSVSIGLGSATYANGSYSVAVGNTAKTEGHSRAVALGNASNAAFDNSVALGTNAKTTRVGEVNVGADTSGRGYNSTNYRVIGGVHDGVDAHDAMTVGQANALIDAINTALGSSIPHIGS